MLFRWPRIRRGKAPNSAYIEVVYRHFLNREVDPNALQNLTKQLNRGRDMRDIIDGIIGSQEYASKHMPREIQLSSGQPRIWTGPNQTYKSYTRIADIKSIIILKVDHIGDFALAIDAFLLIRRAFPSASITVLCGPWNEPFARKLAVFDKIETIDFFSARADAPQPHFDPATVAHLRALHFDLAIDLRVDPDSRLLLDHLTADYRCGYESGLCKVPLTIAIPKQILHSVNNLVFHQRLAMLSLAHAVVNFFQLDDEVAKAFLRVSAAEIHFDLSFRNGRPLVSMQPFSGRALKNWPIDNMIKLANWLCDEMEVSVLLLGTSNDTADPTAIAQACQSPYLKSAIGETTLTEAISIIADSDFYIGNDTGLTHIAARMNIPTVAIYSGIDAKVLFAPYGQNVTVIEAPVACSPCGLRMLADCRHNRKCMLSIDFEFVRSTVEAQLRASIGRHKE